VKRFPVRRIEGVQFVSRGKADMLTVVREPVDAVDTGEGSILADDFGC
jgi:hypothetical protein